MLGFQTASAQSCWLKASELDDVYVVVYNVDQYGARQRIIWRGTIPAGARQSITSDTGTILIASARDQRQALIAGEPQACADENIITVNSPEL